MLTQSEFLEQLVAGKLVHTDIKRLLKELVSNELEALENLQYVLKTLQLEKFEILNQEIGLSFQLDNIEISDIELKEKVEKLIGIVSLYKRTDSFNDNEFMFLLSEYKLNQYGLSACWDFECATYWIKEAQQIILELKKPLDAKENESALEEHEKIAKSLFKSEKFELLATELIFIYGDNITKNTYSDIYYFLNSKNVKAFNNHIDSNLVYRNWVNSKYGAELLRLQSANQARGKHGKRWPLFIEIKSRILGKKKA